MSASCSHDHRAARSSEEIAAALRAIETAILDGRGKWTEPRRRVAELLLQTQGPVKAYDLIARFHNGKAAGPPTVYRALEFLEHANVVHRIASLNAYVLCDRAVLDHTAAFMICDCCGSAREFRPGAVDAANRAADQAGFRARAVAMEVRGRCRHCA